tara:strand:- start:1054 stop:1776 length:723 start_codon:yes stop_codon:yes gene_type:complete
MNKEKLNELLKTIADNPVPMSGFQIRNYVVNPQIAPVRKVRQLFLELKSRMTGKETAELNLKRRKVKKEMTIENIEKAKSLNDDLTVKLLNVDLEEHDLSIRNIEQNIEHCKQEMQVFLDMLDEADKEYNLKELMTGKMHDEEIERKYWIERMARQATLDLISVGSISVGNMDSIINMDKDDQQKVFNKATEEYYELKSGLEDAERKYLPSVKDERKYLLNQPTMLLENGDIKLDKDILE